MAYVAPTPADLKLRYPAFADVADETVQYWLTDAERVVGETWREADRAVAMIAYAAHMMSETGALAASTPAGATAMLSASGVTSFRSGSFSASISESAASATGLQATIYGREFLALQRASFGGPRLAWTPPAAGLGYLC